MVHLAMILRATIKIGRQLFGIAPPPAIFSSRTAHGALTVLSLAVWKLLVGS